MKPTEEKETPRSGCSPSEAGLESTVETAPKHKDTPTTHAVELVITDSEEDAEILRKSGYIAYGKETGPVIPNALGRVVFAARPESAFDIEFAKSAITMAEKVPAAVSVCIPISPAGAALASAAASMNGTFAPFIRESLAAGIPVPPNSDPGFISVELALGVLSVMPESLRPTFRGPLQLLASSLDQISKERLFAKAAPLFGVSVASMRKSAISPFHAPTNTISVGGVNVRIVEGEKMEIVELRRNEQTGQTYEVVTPLAYFTPTIVEEITLHVVGGETRKEYAILCVSGKKCLPEVRIPSRDFARLDWVAENFGQRAKLPPMNPAKREILRCAIEETSAPRFESVYQEVGWRKIEGTRVYLHAGGGIGPKGVMPARVEADDRLRHAVLPSPCLTMDVAGQIEKLLACAPAEKTWTLLAAAFRAPLMHWHPQCDSLFVMGRSGSQKTSLVTVFQQFFGAGFGFGRGNARPPASFNDTPKSILQRCHAAADMLVVVDDYAPASSEQGAARQQRDAEELFRAVGNHASRGRLTQESKQMSGFYPRGLLVATGEDCQFTESVQARLFVIEIGRGEIDLDTLTEVQEMANSGVFAGLMSDYIAWLAECGEPTGQPALIKLNGHARAAGMLANLGWGLRNMFAWLIARGIDADWCAAMEQIGMAALAHAAEKSSRESTAVDPVERFLDLLRQSVAKGAARIIPSKSVEVDEDAGRVPVVGYHEGDIVWLLPAPALAAVKRLGAESGRHYTISERGTGKRLHEAGELLSTDATRGTLTIRKTLDGQPNLSVWEMPAALFFEPVGKIDPIEIPF